MTHPEANVPSQLDIDIELVAQQLRQIIDEARHQNAANLSSVAASPACTSAIYDMQHHMFVNAHWDIAWPRWPPGVRAKVTALYQKLTRRLLKWYIDPIVSQQNQFNHATLRAVQSILVEVLDMRSAMAARDNEQQARLAVTTAQLSTFEQTLSGK